MLGYNSLKSKDLSHLIDSRIGNPDANPHELNEAALINNNYTTFTGASATGFTVTSDGGGTHTAGTTDAITLTAGIRYFVTFTLTLNSGTAPSYNIRSNLGGTTRSEEGAQTAANGFNAFVFLCNYSDTGALEFRNASTATNYSVSGVSIKEWNGEELVPDADVGFVANTVAAWSGLSNNTAVNDGNAIRFTYVDDTHMAMYLRQSVSGSTFNNAIAGEKYKVVCKAKVNSGSSVDLRIYDGAANGSSQNVSSTSYSTFVFEYTVASGTSPYLNVFNFGSGETIWVEVISAMKITGLVAAYNMIPNGSTLVDISGNGLNGTAYNNPISTKDGVRFNSNIISHYRISGFADSTNLDINDSFTVTGRCLVRDASLDQYVFNFGDVNGYRVCVGYDSGAFSFTTYDGASKGVSIAARENQWTDFVAICVDNNLKFYVNGVATNGVTNCSLSAGSELVIGARSVVYTYGYEGEIANLNFYNYAFSEQEAIDYHNSFAKQVKQKHSFDDLGVGSTIG
jgi:hypothetical protein